MKNFVVVPAIEYLMREYHGGLLQVMRHRGQTQAQAADFLGISVPTFHKILRMRWQLNFHSTRGQDLSNSFERWSGLPIDVLFPPAFFTKQFVERNKTHRASHPLTLLMQAGDHHSITLQLTEVSQSPKASAPETKKRRRKRRSKNK